MCIIFSDRCWVVHIPFVCMVEFKFLAHLPVDHMADPIVSSLILLLLLLLFGLLADWLAGWFDGWLVGW